MAAICRSFEEVVDEISTEQEVKDYVSKIFLQLQNFKFEFRD
jgi:hypothetical protein